MKREVNKIIFRCNDSDVMKMNDQSRNKGYHYFIQKNGSVQGVIPITQAGNHTKDHNKDSIGICLQGMKELTNDQFRSLAALIRTLAAKFKLKKAFLIGDTDNFDVERFTNGYLSEFAKAGQGTLEVPAPKTIAPKTKTSKVTGSVKVETESKAAEQD